MAYPFRPRSSWEDPPLSPPSSPEPAPADPDPAPPPLPSTTTVNTSHPSEHSHSYTHTHTSESASSHSLPSPPGPPGAPPGYAPTQPQILVLPLPDAPGFFWGRTLQGEVFVKGLGEARTRSVQSLTVTTRLTDAAPGLPNIDPIELPPHVLYHSHPDAASAATTTSAAASATQDHPFPASHRFAIPLPASMPDGSVLPASLELGAAGSLRWTLHVRLALLSGEVLTEMVNIEGAPPELGVSGSPTRRDCEDANGEEQVPSEAKLERDGVCVRLLLACSRPRLGDPLRIGVEVRPKKPERATLAGLVAQPDPDETLRPLRRVRVELVRLVDTAPPDTPESTSTQHTHMSVIHASGKSLRYPGKSNPPLRVLFALSTAPLHQGVLAAGGEISARTPYHTVRFVVRATLGFGSIGDATGPGSTDPARDWCIEEEIVIRPPLWHEPHTAVIERGVVPVPGHAELGPPPEGSQAAQEAAREAYRRKGQDTVGSGGTTRVEAEASDLPPPFDDQAGPSGTSNGASGADSALPTFTESEAQMRSGAAPLINSAVPSQLLQTVDFEDPFPPTAPPPRRSSLTGELGTWVEYDGYERFSAPPPPAAASFGVESLMDPPREGEDEGPADDVVSSMVARLGLPSGSAPNPAELMEQLGLGQGTRVVDLQDDLPPGIDEPSLPALPGFGSQSGAPARNFARPHAHAHAPHTHTHAPQHTHTHAPPFDAPGHDHPPSFAASEAAEAVGGVARSRVGSITVPAVEMDAEHGDAPPGYFGGGPPAYS